MISIEIMNNLANIKFSVSAVFGDDDLDLDKLLDVAIDKNNNVMMLVMSERNVSIPLDLESIKFYELISPYLYAKKVDAIAAMKASLKVA